LGKEKERTESKLSRIQEYNTRYVRNLIRNQFSIIHHSDNQIANFAKIAAILLGLASLFGLPQTLEDPSNIFMAGAASSLVILSAICVIVIVYALLNIGGWGIKFKMSPTQSLWWHTDNRLDGLIRKKNTDSIIEKVVEDVIKKIEKQSEEIEYKREVATLVILYARAQDQVKICRRIRYFLIAGILWTFCFFIGYMTGAYGNENIISVMNIIIPGLILVLGICTIILLYYYKMK